ncbi:MAG: EAL domain-containing protein [Guyparkeria sp.]|uniref:EAL domain-containing protein n=1 Tax=Guyparkeria sp. TaxID=2035736 RepID=UPI00397B3057
MMPPDTPFAARTYLLMVIAACAAIGAVGLSVPLVVDEQGPLGPPLPPINAAAALLAALGLAAHLQRWRVLQYLGGGLLLALALHGLWRNFAGVEVVAVSTLLTSADGLSCDISLLLLAVAICLLIPGGTRRARRPWPWVGWLMVLLGAFSAVWVSFGQAPWLSFQSSATWTGILFALLFGVALIVAARQEDGDLRPLGQRAIIAAVVGSLLSALAWHHLSLRHDSNLQRMGASQLDRIEAIAHQTISDRVDVLQRLAERWSDDNGWLEAEEARLRDAHSYLRDFPEIHGLAWIDQGLDSRLEVDRSPAAADIRVEALASEPVREWLATGSTAPRLRLLHDAPGPGDVTAMVKLPLSGEGDPPRWLLATLDLGRMLQAPVRLNATVLSAHLLDDGQTVLDLYSDPDRHDHLAVLAERDLALPYGPTLHATAYLEQGQESPVAGLLPSAVALIGLAATALIALLLAIGCSRLHQARRLMRIRNELEAQQQIQSMILHGESLDDTLDRVCQLIEDLAPEYRCAILLADGERRTLSLAAAPRLPAPFREAIDSVPIAPNRCACCRAVHLGEPVFTEDITTDPHWEPLRNVALDSGLRACWAYPLLSSANEVLGAFATYRDTPGLPRASHGRQIARTADLVSLAIERNCDREALEENEQRFRSLFRYNPDAVFSLDLDGRLGDYNHATQTILARSAEDLVGRTFVELVDTEDRQRVAEAVQRTGRGRSQRTELAVTHADGSRHELDVTYLPIVINGSITGIYAIAKDITIRKRQENRLRILERSVEASMHGVVIVDALDPGLPIVYTNAAFSRITGYAPDEVLGRNCRFLQDEETDPESLEEIRRGIAERRPVQVLLRNRRKDGSLFWNELHIAPVEDDNGEITHYVGLQNDVSEQKSYEKQLAFNATHDNLTGLANRALFEDRLEHMVKLSRRRGTRVGVLFIDLDEFKPINDSLGHAVGDRILMEVAKRLADQVREEDTLARFGGDEFVVLLTDIHSEADTFDVAERLLPVIARPYRLEDHELYLSASIGIAVSESDTENPLSLIQQADMAMYRAKQQGHNTCQLFTGEINSQLLHRVGLRNDLQEAIEHEDFEVHYQPLVHSDDQRIVGLEALLRWHHPKHGHVSPATFIPLAEETGQIIPLSEWVLDRAARDMVNLCNLGLADARMAINLSPVQFNRPNFLDTIRRTLARTGLPAARLELELTEGILMNDTESAIEVLKELRDSRISVSIDDFGTGFSSLSYLKNLPIDTIKIDRSFVQHVETSDDDAAIVQGVISMAHHLGLRVVAEGIETDTQREILTRYGCDILQGYFFARPMPIAELTDYLERTRQIDRD